MAVYVELKKDYSNGASLTGVYPVQLGTYGVTPYGAYPLQAGDLSMDEVAIKIFERDNFPGLQTCDSRIRWSAPIPEDASYEDHSFGATGLVYQEEDSRLEDFSCIHSYFAEHGALPRLQAPQMVRLIDRFTRSHLQAIATIREDERGRLVALVTEGTLTERVFWKNNVVYVYHEFGHGDAVLVDAYRDVKDGEAATDRNDWVDNLINSSDFLNTGGTGSWAVGVHVQTPVGRGGWLLFEESELEDGDNKELRAFYKNPVLQFGKLLPKGCHLLARPQAEDAFRHVGRLYGYSDLGDVDLAMQDTAIQWAIFGREVYC